MFTKRRSSPVSSRRRSFRPGYCASRPSIHAASVSPAPGTTSCSFVSLRRGVGMRTIMLNRRLSCPGSTPHSGSRCIAIGSCSPDPSLGRRTLALKLQDPPAAVVRHISAADVGNDIELFCQLPDNRLLDQLLNERELHALLLHHAGRHARSATASSYESSVARILSGGARRDTTASCVFRPAPVMNATTTSS